LCEKFAAFVCFANPSFVENEIVALWKIVISALRRYLLLIGRDEFDVSP